MTHAITAGNLSEIRSEWQKLRTLEEKIDDDKDRELAYELEKAKSLLKFSDVDWKNSRLEDLQFLGYELEDWVSLSTLRTIQPEKWLEVLNAFANKPQAAAIILQAIKQLEGDFEPGLKGLLDTSLAVLAQDYVEKNKKRAREATLPKQASMPRAKGGANTFPLGEFSRKRFIDNFFSDDRRKKRNSFSGFNKTKIVFETMLHQEPSLFLELASSTDFPVNHYKEDLAAIVKQSIDKNPSHSEKVSLMRLLDTHPQVIDQIDAAVDLDQLVEDPNYAKSASLETKYLKFPRLNSHERLRGFTTKILNGPIDREFLIHLGLENPHSLASPLVAEEFHKKLSEAFDAFPQSIIDKPQIVGALRHFDSHLRRDKKFLNFVKAQFKNMSHEQKLAVITSLNPPGDAGEVFDSFMQEIFRLALTDEQVSVVLTALKQLQYSNFQKGPSVMDDLLVEMWSHTIKDQPSSMHRNLALLGFYARQRLQPEHDALIDLSLQPRWDASAPKFEQLIGPLAQAEPGDPRTHSAAWLLTFQPLHSSLVWTDAPNFWSQLEFRQSSLRYLQSKRSQCSAILKELGI